MTWTKIDENFPEDCARVQLSDAAVRTHLEALVWSMRRENGGRLRARDLDRLADTEHPEAAADELVSVGFWTQLPDGWQVEHQMGHQLEPEVIAARRAMNAERQRKYRRNAAGLPEDDPDPTTETQAPVTRDVTRDETRDPEQSRTEQSGSEKEVLRATSQSEIREEVQPDATVSPFRRRYPA